MVNVITTSYCPKLLKSLISDDQFGIPSEHFTMAFSCSMDGMKTTMECTALVMLTKLLLQVHLHKKQINLLSFELITSSKNI